MIPHVLPGLVLGTILSLPTCYADRKDTRLFDHLVKTAYAISEEAKDEDEAAYLVAIGESESRFCIGIQENRGHSGALSMWQIEWGTGRYGPLIGLSYDSIHNAAHAATVALRRSWNCGPAPRDRFTAYYGGVRCGAAWPSLDNRVSLYWYARNRMTGR